MEIADHRLTGALHRLNDAVLWVKRYRHPLTIPFALLFVIGLLYSGRQFGIKLDSLHIVPALLLFFVLAPMGLLYGAVGLKLLSNITATSIKLRDAWKIEGYAQLADALPLPGGPLVRTSALMQSGARFGKSAIVVTATGVMWIAIAAIGAGIALFAKAQMAAYALIVPGVAVFIAIMGWIVFEAGIKAAGLLLFHRLAGVALVSLRMIASFAIVGQFIAVDQAALFSFANIAGSAVVVAPAGLGVSEMIGSALSKLVAVDPAATFLAIGIGRIVGLLSSCCMVMMNNWLERPPEAWLARKPIS